MNVYQLLTNLLHIVLLSGTFDLHTVTALCTVHVQKGATYNWFKYGTAVTVYSTFKYC